MWRLLVGLCVVLFAAMSIFGNGPARTDGVAAVKAPVRDVATAPPSNGLRVIPLPAPNVVSVSTKSAPPGLAVTASAGAAPMAAEVAVPPRAGADGSAEALPANVHRRWISASTANVRSAPSKRSELAGKITAGGAVHVMWSEPNGWVRVRSEAGDVSGFVHQSLLTDIAPLDRTP